jgi:hypothetical protein
MLYFTPVIPSVSKRPLLLRSRNGDFKNMQEAASISMDLMGTIEA